MKFTKKQFQKEYKGKEVDELYKLGDENPGRPNLPSNSQITTDTKKSKLDDFSDYEEDIPVDTDKVKSNTKNTYMDDNSSFTFNMGTPYVKEGNIDETPKERMQRLVKELLQKRNNDNEFVNKISDLDINKNNVSDIDDLNNPDISVAANDLINAIKSSDLNNQELEMIFNHIKDKIK